MLQHTLNTKICHNQFNIQKISLWRQRDSLWWIRCQKQISFELSTMCLSWYRKRIRKFRSNNWKNSFTEHSSSFRYDRNQMNLLKSYVTEELDLILSTVMARVKCFLNHEPQFILQKYPSPSLEYTCMTIYQYHWHSG